MRNWTRYDTLAVFVGTGTAAIFGYVAALAELSNLWIGGIAGTSGGLATYAWCLITDSIDE